MFFLERLHGQGDLYDGCTKQAWRGLVRSCDEMAAEAAVVLVAVAVAVTVADIMVVACGGCCRRRTRRAFSTVLVIAEPGERARS